MVNWKASENIDRLIGTLIAAHPNLKLEYQAMATLFGQGATYDAIEGRFRKYRKMADELKAEAAGRGITELPRGRNNSGSSTPRTPRGSRSNGVTKLSTSASIGKGKKDPSLRAITSPTKRSAGRNVSGRSIMDAIFVDDGPGLAEDETKVKNEAAEILSGIGGGGVFSEVEIINPPTGITVSTPITKIEESSGEHPVMSTFSSPSTCHHLSSNGFMNTDPGASNSVLASTCGLSEANTLDSLGITHDAFDMSGLYFSHNHGGYDMDDSIYGGTA